MHHDTSLPPRRGGTVSRLALALAAATLFGCSDRSATGPEDPLADEAGAPAAAVEASTVEASTTEASTAVATASRLPKSFFVNPKSGSDTGPGSQAKPFKTLAKGLSLAIAGDTIRLASGTYSTAANGEKFTTSARQVTVPAGVKVFGTPDPFVILQGGAGDLIGLNLRGAATVRNIHLFGFPTAVTASQGVQSFTGVVLDGNQVGLKLAGSAKATLTSSTVFVRPGIGSLAASGVQQAQLTVSGGAISAGQPNCGTGANGVLLRDAARFTMNNGATFANIMGTVVEIHETAKATLSKLAKIQRDFTGFAGCNPQGGVSAFDSTTLSLQNAQIVSTNGGKNAVGIFWGSRGSVSLDSSVIKGQAFGLYGPGNVKLVASNTVFQFNFFGIDVDGASPKIVVVKSTVSNNAVGIRATGLLVRRTLITSNQQTGVLLTGGSGNDLGVVGDLGVNLIAANGITGVGFDPKVTGGGVILAVGNSWNPVTQGTDGSGHYPVMTVLGTSINPPVVGKNFFLPATADFRIGL